MKKGAPAPASVWSARPRAIGPSGPCSRQRSPSIEATGNSMRSRRPSRARASLRMRRIRNWEVSTFLCGSTTGGGVPPCSVALGEAFVEGPVNGSSTGEHREQVLEREIAELIGGCEKRGVRDVDRPRGGNPGFGFVLPLHGQVTDGAIAARWRPGRRAVVVVQVHCRSIPHFRWVEGLRNSLECGTAQALAAGRRPRGWVGRVPRQSPPGVGRPWRVRRCCPPLSR